MAGARRFGDLLLELGFIDEPQLQEALDQQRRTGQRLGRILIQSGAITEARLVRALSRQLGIEVCTPLTANIHPRVKALVPPEMAFRFHVLPIALTRDASAQTLFVATADPLDMVALDALRRQTGPQVRVRWLLAGETEIDLALARLYGVERPSVGGTPLPHLPTDVDALLDAAVSPLVDSTPRLIPGEANAPLWQSRPEVPSDGEEPEPLELVPLASAFPDPAQSMTEPRRQGSRSQPAARAANDSAAEARLETLEEPPPRAAPIRLEPAHSWGDLVAGDQAPLETPDLLSPRPLGDVEMSPSPPVEEERFGEPGLLGRAPIEPPVVFGEDLEDAPASLDDFDDFDLPIEESPLLVSETPMPIAIWERPAAAPRIAASDELETVSLESGADPTGAAQVSFDLQAAESEEAPWAAALAEAAARALEDASLHAFPDEQASEEVWLGDTLDPRRPGAADAVSAVPAPAVQAPAEASGPQAVAKARRAIDALIAGEAVDSDGMRAALRVIASVLVEEGLLDDARIARALAKPQHLARSQ